MFLKEREKREREGANERSHKTVCEEREKGGERERLERDAEK